MILIQDELTYKEVKDKNIIVDEESINKEVYKFKEKLYSFNLKNDNYDYEHGAKIEIYNKVKVNFSGYRETVFYKSLLEKVIMANLSNRIIQNNKGLQDKDEMYKAINNILTRKNIDLIINFTVDKIIKVSQKR